MAPIGPLLTAVGSLKFSFGVLIATFRATSRITGDRFGMKFADFWLVFASVWRHDIWQLCPALAFYLTCANDTITGVSLIAFTPVAHRTSSRAQVRCNRSTGGVRMTYIGCVGCTGTRV